MSLNWIILNSSVSIQFSFSSSNVAFAQKEGKILHMLYIYIIQLNYTKTGNINSVQLKNWIGAMLTEAADPEPLGAFPWCSATEVLAVSGEVASAGRVVGVRGVARVGSNRDEREKCCRELIRRSIYLALLSISCIVT